MHLEQRHFLHRLCLGAVQDVGIYLRSVYVGMAHKLLDGEYRHVVGEQQDAEGVARGVEHDGFLYAGIPAPSFQHLVHPLV